jgi:hypothetical protein
MKYALLSQDGQSIDTISYHPDRELVPATPAEFNEDGTIKTPAVEEHWGNLLPGWVEVPDDVFAGFVKQGPNWVQPTAPLAPMPDSLEPYSAVCSQVLDDVARGKGYDNRVSILSYRDSTVPGWAEEAQQFAEYRDSLFNKAFEIYAKFQAGEIPQPSLEEFEAMLPTPPWPANDSATAAK